MARFIVKY